MEEGVPVTRSKLRALGAMVLACAGVSLAPPASGAEPTKDECITANESAQALQKDSRLRAAKEQLQICVSKSCPGPVRDDCQQRLDAVAKATPTIVFDAKDALGNAVTAVTVTVDGAPLADHLDGTALVVDPGQHQFAFSAPGMNPLQRAIQIQPGEQNRHESLVLVARPTQAPPLPPPTATATSTAQPPSPETGGSSRMPAYVAFGAGAVGLVVGAVFTGMWFSAKSSGDSACIPRCDAATANDYESKQKTDTAVLALGYGIAVAGAAVGTYLWLQQPADQPATGLHVVPRIGPGWAGLEGRFQ